MVYGLRDGLAGCGLSVSPSLSLSFLYSEREGFSFRGIPVTATFEEEALLVPGGLRFTAEVFDSDRGYVNKEYLDYLKMGIRQKLSNDKAIMSELGESSRQDSSEEESVEEDDALSDLEEHPTARPAAPKKTGSYFSSVAARGFLSTFESFSSKNQQNKINFKVQNTTDQQSTIIHRDALPKQAVKKNQHQQNQPPSRLTADEGAYENSQSRKKSPGRRLLATITPRCSDFHRLNSFAMKAVEERYRNFISIKDRLRFEKHITKKSMKERARRKLEKGHQQQEAGNFEEGYHYGASSGQNYEEFYWSVDDRHYYA